MFYERLETAREHDFVIGDHPLKVLYEKPRAGFTYGCSPLDVFKVLESAAGFLPCFPDIIAFRQPTRKQQQQRPVWGRFLYFAEFGKHEGTAVVIEAQALGETLNWPRRMTIEDRAEFERLKSDGHVFVEMKRYFQSELTEDAVRNTVLYRTLLHELGHMAHFHQDVIDRRTALDKVQSLAEVIYFSKPSSEREVFAHAFADKIGQLLRAAGAIPFPVASIE